MLKNTGLHRVYKRLLSLALMAGCLVLMLTGCKGEETASSTFDNPFASRETADLSGYHCMEGYKGESMLVPTDVKEVAELMAEGKTFAFIASFEKCPFCNVILPYVNDAAAKAGVPIGYIDTRANPEWSSNLDIDDYDLFVELFGDWLNYDSDGILHLYVPDLYFIADGEVAAHHQGVYAGADDPKAPLTAEQEAGLKALLEDCFGKLK